VQVKQRRSLVLLSIGIELICNRPVYAVVSCVGII
jgi:hypothetical protein